MKETLTNSKGITNEIILYIPYTNNQCNLLDSFYAVFQLKLKQVLRNLRVEEFKRIAVVMEI